MLMYIFLWISAWVPLKVYFVLSDMFKLVGKIVTIILLYNLEIVHEYSRHISTTTKIDVRSYGSPYAMYKLP